MRLECLNLPEVKFQGRQLPSQKLIEKPFVYVRNHVRFYRFHIISENLRISSRELSDFVYKPACAGYLKVGYAPTATKEDLWGDDDSRDAFYEDQPVPFVLDIEVDSLFWGNRFAERFLHFADNFFQQYYRSPLYSSTNQIRNAYVHPDDGIEARGYPYAERPMQRVWERLTKNDLAEYLPDASRWRFKLLSEQS